PTTAEGLAALAQRPPGVDVWNGPYVKGGTVPVDPWGNLTKGYRTRNNRRTQNMIVSRRKK
ncbi:MAG: type II secretion system protein GspG, partial [Gammaproteobacteria bacterium]